MTTNSLNPVQERIASGSMSLRQWIVVFLCMTLNMVDGFDIVAMSAIAPGIAADWEFSPQTMGLLLAAALIGMTLGAVYLAPLADKLGRRTMILYAAFGTSICLFLSAVVPQSVELMFAIRILTGLGVGVIMASTTTVATEFSATAWRNALIPVIVMGYPFGALCVSPVAEWLLDDYGWRSMFAFGGVATAAVAVAAWLWMPESLDFLSNKDGDEKQRLSAINKILISLRKERVASVPAPLHREQAAKISSLLQPQYRSLTIQLWILFFAGLFNMYFLLSWIPSLFENSGFTPSEGRGALLYFNIGGVLGIMGLSLITSRVHLLNTILIFFVVSSLAMLAFGLGIAVDSVLSMNLLILIIGFFFQGGYTGMYTISARFYPSQIRATGVGWAIGLGRTGAILSPIIAGVLVGTLGWPMEAIFLFFATPMILMAAISWRIRHVRLN